MSFGSLGSLKNGIKGSLQSLNNLINAQPISPDEETAIQNNQAVVKKMSGVVTTTSTNKTRQLMDDISAAIDKDEANDGVEDNASSTSKLRVVRTKDYLGDKANRIPSVSELVNKPLADSFGGLAGADPLPPSGSFGSLNRITARDLQRSVSQNLDITEPSKIKKKSKSKSSLAASKTGSVLSLLNDPLQDAETMKGRDDFKTSLGITAKDLRKSLDAGLNNSLSGKVKTKSKGNLASSKKGSVADLVNKPLEEEYGPAEPRPAPIASIPMNKSISSLINGPSRFYTATEADKKRNAEQQSTTIDMGALSLSDDPTRQPLMSDRSNY
jgi:hypothetical protein